MVTVAIMATLPRELAAQTDVDDNRPDLLPRDEEFALALSAAPEHLRSGAAVYVLEESGYVLAREGSNGFACIVNRDHPRNRKPTCYDAEGAKTCPKRGCGFRRIMDGARS